LGQQYPIDTETAQITSVIMTRKLTLFLAVMCLSAASAQDQSLSEEQKDPEYSSYSGLLNIIDTHRSDKPAKKTVIIHNSRRYIVELAYTLKMTTIGVFDPMAKTQEVISESVRDSLSFYFLMDLKEKLLYIFDLDKTLLCIDSLKNKTHGVFFDGIEHEVTSDFHREITEDSKVIAEKDTLLLGKRHKAIHIAHHISSPGDSISSIQYVNTDYRPDFPLYGDNVLGKGFRGVLGGTTLYIGKEVDEGLLLVFESGLPEEDRLLFQELLTEARKNEISPELGGFRDAIFNGEKKHKTNPLKP